MRLINWTKLFGDSEAKKSELTQLNMAKVQMKHL